MALQIETIRATADRVAASHHLEVVDIEFTGGAKHRVLRVFLEKDAEARARFVAEAASNEAAGLPKGVPVETLSGVTHEDCANFARDFGTVLDIEDLIPGAEYTLEVSSPGLERKLLRAADYERFRGSLAKIQTFTAVDNNRHFTGRLMDFDGKKITLDLSSAKQKSFAKQKSSANQRSEDFIEPKSKAKKVWPEKTVEIPLANIEKANLIAEI